MDCPEVMRFPLEGSDPLCVFVQVEAEFQEAPSERIDSLEGSNLLKGTCLALL